ncbi:MAG: hypothetical protein JO012_02720 [Hyphomicrobiales bacterium]|jgi:hypothetical protein|nr:hypothetical protein [Hyphomicrobiales bacterium]
MLGQQPQLRAQEPTTDGIIALLSGFHLRDRWVGVQLYPDAGDRLVAFLAGTGAVPDPVNSLRIRFVCRRRDDAGAD